MRITASCRAAMAVATFSFALAANAETVTLSFDEPGITLGDALTTQYASEGVTFSGTAIIKNGTADYFNNPFTTDGNIVHFDLRPTDAVMTLDMLADSLSIDYRRPGNAGALGFELRNGTTTVLDATNITWNGPDWETFTYDGSNGAFDTVLFISSNKFVIDNVSFDTAPAPVPVPLPLWLALSGLVPLLRARRAA